MGIYRFKFGNRIITNSVILDINYSDIKELDRFFHYEEANDLITFRKDFDNDARIFGLGENVKGINKRGSHFKSFNFDDSTINEGRTNLYASHNFFIVSCQMNSFGVFIDTPKLVNYDFCFSSYNEIEFSTYDGFDLYIIESNDFYPEISIIERFREMIGKSYIAPFFSFGVGQSRWGYMGKGDLEDVIDGFSEKKLPLDMLFFDIDCLDNFKDFTLNSSFYKDGDIDYEFFKSCKNNGIHLVPIVDAAVKAEKGYDLYDELIDKKGYVSSKDGKPYIVGVWPGDSLLPDYLSENGSKVFGKFYKKYLDLGIDGFWNDMNEPALFYGKEEINNLGKFLKDIDYNNFSHKDYEIIRDKVRGIKNCMVDYKNMYHKYDLEYKDNNIFNHYDVHNMYGYKMVESAHNYFKEYNKENNLNKKYLLFSRSSMIGSHRYSGIWTGDNASFWDHLLMNIKMMPSLNMCGYLYSGADIGGFGNNASEDLVLRWMAFGIFTPLFRNHSCKGMERQDYHLLENTDIVRNILSIRYALIPYLYSEYIKAINNNTLLFTPLSFVFDDERTIDIEDELLVGKSIIIAPIYNQNSNGRMVYLPVDALEVRMKSGNNYETIHLTKGDPYISVGIDEVVFFLINKEILPLARIDDIKNIKNINSISYNNLVFINNGYKHNKYQMYEEVDGEVKERIFNIK